MEKKPHIIIINPDEMRWDTMGHMGNPAACTPRLDEFACTEAVSFSRAFCQNPVCVPSRCSFFTGLYPHVSGHRTMGNLLKEGEPTLLSELKNAGYYVWANARNDLIAAEKPGLVESHVSEFYYGGNVPPAPGSSDPHPRGKPDSARFYSFCNGQLQVDENGKNYTADDEDVDAACARIQSYDSDKPLCLFVGMLYPHPPYNVEEPYYSRIDRAQLPKRVDFGETDGKSKMLALLHQYENLDGMTPAEWNELRAIYLGMCAKVDEQFGRIVDALKERGIYDDSLIIFLSDHGDYAGDYSVIEKAQNCFEDVLTRVPLLIKPPKDYPVDPGITDSLVELVDFYATVMDYAGVESSHTHFGRSLAPVLKNRTAEVRDAVFCEGGRNASEAHCSESVDPAIRNGFRMSVMWPRYAAQFDNEAHTKGTMIRTAEWKYIYRAHGESELYDLSRDPQEKINVASLPENASICSALREKILSWYQDTVDIVPFERNERFSKQMVWEKIKLQCPKGHEEEVKEKINAGMSLFPAQAFCKELRERSANNG